MNKNSKKALVLLNMGGARNKAELKMFLTNMFNDKNILTIKSNFFRSLLASVIVKSRLDSVWKNYELIGNASPLNLLSLKLIDKLNQELSSVSTFQVMLYTPPFAKECIEKLEKQGIKEVILFPLYPQYSTTTTKSSVEDFISGACNKFNIITIEPFYKNEVFNEAILETIKNTLSDASSYHLIFSAHGLPQKIVNNGDPYELQIKEHVEILSKLLKEKRVEFKSISLAFQSTVGPMKWLEPSLGDCLKNYKDEKVLIYPISFIVDNSETDFELSIEYKEEALEYGIVDYKVCKCVNYNDKFIEAIKDITKLS